MLQDQERPEESGGNRICVCGEPQPGSDAVGRQPWSLIGCAVSGEGSSCSIAAICESSASEVGR